MTENEVSVSLDAILLPSHFVNTIMATVLPERQTTQRAILNIIENDVVQWFCRVWVRENSIVPIGMID